MPTPEYEPPEQRRDRRRLDAILGAAGMVGYEWDVERGVIHHLGDIQAMTGHAFVSGDRFTAFVHPDDQHAFTGTLRDSWLNDREYRHEFRIVRTDGAVRRITDVGRPAVFPDGRRWMSGVLTDVTDQRASEAAARDSRTRLADALEAAGLTAWEWDPETGVVTHTEDLAGNTDGPIRSREALIERMHPDDRARVGEAFAKALAEGGEYQQEYRLIRPDGQVSWVISRGRVRVGADGRRRMSGMLGDVTARKTADLQRQLLINELNHRVKNTLAIVQGIASQTFRGDAGSATAVFQGRLMALSTAHNVLTRETWEGAGMREIVADALRPFDEGGGRIAVSGPDLRLPPKTAVALAMGLHELAANAVRYGSLSNDAGRVDVRWSGAEGRLRLNWREREGPPVTAPARRGFGTRMLERGLASELGGVVNIAFTASGLECSVDAPLPDPTEPHA